MKTQPRLTIEYAKPADLKPHPKNARNHSPEQIDRIIRSVESVGWTKPIIVDEKMEILAGHGAHKAAMQMGMEEVPYIKRVKLTEAQKRAYRLADNAIAEKSTWDAGVLTEELQLLKGMGFDLALTGFDQDEISFMLAPPPTVQPEPPVPPSKPPQVSREGDIWQMGEHRIICGDNGKAKTWNALFNGREAQCVFTDPPYGISYVAPSGQFEMIKGDDMRRGQLAKMLQAAFEQAAKHTRADAGWYIWHASATHQDFAEALRNVGIAELGQIIWAKPGIVLGWADYRWAHEPCIYGAKQGIKPAFHGDRSSATIWRIHARGPDNETHVAIGTGVTAADQAGGEITITAGAPKGKKVRHVHLKEGEHALLQTPSEVDSLWEVSRDNGHGKDNQLHPNQKPVELPRRAIVNSTREGEIVVDFFSGSGSTIIAAEQTKRVAYAIELDPTYVDVDVRRWQTLTGKQAIHATENKTFDEIAAERAK
jgi:DNA modification methylase